jgi:hypothetical protein
VSGEQWSDANTYASWTQYGSVAFYKDPLGVVHLRGWAYFDPTGAENGKAAGDTIQAIPIFTLPAGYHPDVSEDFPCIIENADLSRIGANRCEITPTGDVFVPPLYVVMFHQSVVALDGISFRAGS